jgi:hypothetical protein
MSSPHLAHLQSPGGGLLLLDADQQHHARHLNSGLLQPLHHIPQQQQQYTRGATDSCSSSPVDASTGSAGAGMSISSAVRCLNGLSEFGGGMDLAGAAGAYDTFALNDSLLSSATTNGSGSAAGAGDNDHEDDVVGAARRVQTQNDDLSQRDARCRPLMDFKSAFSDLDGSKQTDFRFERAEVFA